MTASLSASLPTANYSVGIGVDPIAKSVDIDRTLSMITADEYQTLERRCYELYGLHYEIVPAHKYNIKCIIK